MGTLDEKLHSLRAGEISAEQNIQNFLDKIENEKYNAILYVNSEALEEARNVDRKIKQGRAGKLSGLAIAVKSNINVKGLKTSCASKTLENYSATYDATVIERIRREDGIVIGMANMDEFACGSSGETSYFGPILNPAARGRIPGGSSSGSAASIAGGLSDLAIGSDTGGSIRNPASHCGIIGIKPTYGLVPRQGLIDLAMSFDQIGTLGRDVYSTALLLEVIAGYSKREAVSRKVENLDYTSKLTPDLEGYKIGYVTEFEELTDRRINSEIKKSLEKLEMQGAELVEVNLPNLNKALPTYYLTTFVEFFSATRKYDGRRYGYKIEDVCGEEILRRIHIGSYISQKEYSGKYYRKALQFRSLITRELLEALRDIDLIAGPTTPKLPHRLGEKISPLDMYSYDVLTVQANLAGIPAGVTRAGEVGNIPVGIQLQAKPLEEQKIFNVMLALEASS